VRMSREQLLTGFPDHLVFDLRGPKVLYLFVVLPGELQGMVSAAEEIAKPGRRSSRSTLQIPLLEIGPVMYQDSRSQKALDNRLDRGTKGPCDAWER
jgi:hypothetical protein